MARRAGYRPLLVRTVYCGGTGEVSYRIYIVRIWAAGRAMGPRIAGRAGVVPHRGRVDEGGGKRDV